MNKDLIKFYNDIAFKYDLEYEAKADYQIPKILKDIYAKNNIESGVILDIGCGTGKIVDTLGSNFTYMGIDIASNMLIEAEKRGYKTYLGAVEDIIKNIENKSVDHIIAMSSLYFVEDIEDIIKEFERVARGSFFLSFEQFDSNTIEMMKTKNINIYNHSNSLIHNPTELIQNIHLWTRPNTSDKIYGDIIFKKLNQ